MTFFTLLSIGLLCLVFKSTRLVGVVGLTIMGLIWPGWALSLMAISVLGVAIYYFYKHRRLRLYAPDKTLH